MNTDSSTKVRAARDVVKRRSGESGAAHCPAYVPCHASLAAASGSAATRRTHHGPDRSLAAGDRARAAAAALRRAGLRPPSASLYDKTSPILFARLLRMLRRRSVAEEALQDVYVRIWERAAQYEAHRGRALAWMVTIARYCAIDLMRRERMTLVGDDALAEVADEHAAEPGGLDKPNNFDDCIGQLSREHAPVPDAGLRRGPLARRDRAAHLEPAGQREELDPPRAASASRNASRRERQTA